MKKKILKWLGVDEIIRDQTRLIQQLESDIMSLEVETRKLNEHLRMDVGVDGRGKCSVILTGFYRGRGYVQVYDMHPEEFRDYVEMMRSRGKSNMIRAVDVAYPMKGYFEL